MSTWLRLTTLQSSKASDQRDLFFEVAFSGLSEGSAAVFNRVFGAGSGNIGSDGEGKANCALGGAGAGRSAALTLRRSAASSIAAFATRDSIETRRCSAMNPERPSNTPLRCGTTTASAAMHTAAVPRPCSTRYFTSSVTSSTAPSRITPKHRGSMLTGSVASLLTSHQFLDSARLILQLHLAPKRDDKRGAVDRRPYRRLGA